MTLRPAHSWWGTAPDLWRNNAYRRHWYAEVDCLLNSQGWTWMVTLAISVEARSLSIWTTWRQAPRQAAVRPIAGKRDRAADPTASRSNAAIRTAAVIASIAPGISTPNRLRLTLVLRQYSRAMDCARDFLVRRVLGWCLPTTTSLSSLDDL